MRSLSLCLRVVKYIQANSLKAPCFKRLIPFVRVQEMAPETAHDEERGAKALRTESYGD